MCHKKPKIKITNWNLSNIQVLANISKEISIISYIQYLKDTNNESSERIK